MSDKVEVSGGVSGSTLLTILLIALKLTHVINWSWWWVLSPIWIGAAVVIGVLVLILLGAVMVGAYREWLNK